MIRTPALMVTSPAPGGDVRERTVATMANGALLSLAVVVAAFIKWHYSIACAEELRWLLAPAASLVEWLTGRTFVHEARVGYVAAELSIVIAPACAGVNFFVIALLTLAFGFVSRLKAARDKMLWFAAVPVLAYAGTLFANTVRIAAAVLLHESGARAPLISAGAAHCALGVVVYLPVLWLLYAVSERMLGRVAP